MNRDDIIRMAREQGLPETATEGVFIVNTDDLGRMLAAEREACEKEAQDRIDRLYAMYEQACQQRDALMDQQRAQIEAMRGRIQ